MEEELSNVCPICYEPHNEDSISIKCGHKFHYKCIISSYKNMHNWKPYFYNSHNMSSNKVREPDTRLRERRRSHFVMNTTSNGNGGNGSNHNSSRAEERKVCVYLHRYVNLCVSWNSSTCHCIDCVYTQGGQ